MAGCPLTPATAVTRPARCGPTSRHCKPEYISELYCCPSETVQRASKQTNRIASRNDALPLGDERSRMKILEEGPLSFLFMIKDVHVWRMNSKRAAPE